MSLKKQLKELKAEKKQALNLLHRTYVRTKRDTKRTLSPDRFVRKHIGATIGVAAIAGMLLAPRPARTKIVEKTAPKTDTVGGHFSQLLRNGLMQLERLIPTPKAAHNGTAEHNGKPPKRGGMLAMFLPLLLKGVDINKLMSQVAILVATMGKKAPAAGNGHSPDMRVADAGTVKPDQYEDFQ